MTFIEATLQTQLAVIAGAILLSSAPVILIEALRSRRERRAAFRKAQADKIVVPHPTLTLYRTIERLPRK
jgi:hypothetical protein